MKEYKVEALEEFVEQLDETLNSFINTTAFIRSDLKGQERDAVIKILTDKLEGMKSAKNKKELKKYVDLDVVVDKYGEYHE